MIYVLKAPQATGKTRNAQFLATKLGVQEIVDEWDGKTALPPSCLALTNAEEIGMPAGALVFLANDAAGVAALVSLFSA